ncbi:MAG: Eco57I restriction-modification methylase domain-containing protein, partial [Promethearchaeota archaeon]
KDDEVFLNKLIQNLTFLINLKDINNYQSHFSLNAQKFDIFSSLYEKSRNHRDKKKLGEFFTPNSVVNYILNNIGYNTFDKIEEKKIIDISCGVGSFIVQAVRILKKRCLDIYTKGDISKLTIKQAKTLISIIKKNIIGVDLNPIACLLCQINIQFALFDILKIIRKIDSDYNLPLFNIKNRNALTLDKNEKYDYVIGNPPYLFVRDIPINQRQLIEEGNFKTNEGQYDYYQIFMELGIGILKNQGFLGYIVPDSILALTNRSIIRRYIFNTTKIIELYHTGPTFIEPIVSNIIIILEKNNNEFHRKKNKIKIKIPNQQEQLIQQSILEKLNFKFLIHLNKKDLSILEYLNINFPKLKHLNSKYGIKYLLNRGVELTKKGEIIFCKNCLIYSPIPARLLKCNLCKSPLDLKNTEKIIYKDIPENVDQNKFKPYLYAIKRYKKTPYRYIDISKPGINYKNLENYKDRIIIRQLSQNNKICATYDKNLSLTSQSFYNLKIQKSSYLEFNNFYILGLINSKLFSYFFSKSFGTYKKLFPRILIEKIKDFPIKIPISEKEKAIAKKIIEKVKHLLDESNNIEYSEKIIDSLVFDLYQISEEHRNHIILYMRTLES